MHLLKLPAGLVDMRWLADKVASFLGVPACNRTSGYGMAV